MAAFLDPTIYNLMSENDRKTAKKLIYKKLNNVSIDHLTVSSSSISSTISKTTTTAAPSFIINPLNKLETICGHPMFLSVTTRKSMSLYEETSLYIKEAQSAADFKSFWVAHTNELPRLSNLIRRVNVIPATSVTSEVVFSVANFLQRKQCSSLSSKTLRYLVVLRNRQVLEKFE